MHTCTNKFVAIASLVAEMLLFAGLLPLVTNAQSVAEAAKQQRAQLCKDGRKQYCDGYKTDKAKIVVEEQGSEQVSSTLESSQGTPSVGDLQDRLEELSHKTPRQLADDVVGDVQFPGRDRWESQLSAARDKLVAKMQVVLDLLRLSKPNPTALNNAVFYMKIAHSDYRDVQTQGHAKAADWKRKTNW